LYLLGATGRREQHAPDPADVEPFPREYHVREQEFSNLLVRGQLLLQTELEELESDDSSEDEEMVEADRESSVEQRITRNPASAAFISGLYAADSDFEADVDTRSSPPSTSTPDRSAQLSRRRGRQVQRRPMSLAAQSTTESGPNALGKRFLEGDSDENEDRSSDGSDSSSGSGSKRRKRSL
jgi:hypothetical protein